MFTNLEHNLIIRNILNLLTICFNNAGQSKIATNGCRAYYTDGIDDGRNFGTYNMVDLLYLVEYLLNNSYSMFVGNIFVQNKVVPQGGM